jgi:hypothetical protein
MVATSKLQNFENHLASIATLARADLDKTLPFIERAVDVAASIYPIIGKVGTPLIQAIIKAEAAAQASNGTSASKLASVLSAVGPDVQKALTASGSTLKVEDVVNKAVAGLQQPSAIPGT